MNYRELQERIEQIYLTLPPKLQERIRIASVVGNRVEYYASERARKEYGCTISRGLGTDLPPLEEGSNDFNLEGVIEDEVKPEDILAYEVGMVKSLERHLTEWLKECSIEVTEEFLTSEASKILCKVLELEGGFLRKETAIKLINRG